MKKLFLPISILTLVLVIAGILIYQNESTESDVVYKYSEIIYVVFLIIFFILGIYFGIRRILAGQKGFPEDDELSKRIVQKASSNSFFISLFLWLLLLFIQNGKIMDVRILFGFGLIGMAVAFVISWLVLNYKGIQDE